MMNFDNNEMFQLNQVLGSSPRYASYVTWKENFLVYSDPIQLEHEDTCDLDKK